MGQARDLDMLTEAVETGQITKVEGITELAFRLNANDPESFKMGWPLTSAIKAAGEHFQRKGLDPLTEEEKADVLSRFRFDSENETGAVMVVDGISYRNEVVRIVPWPRGPEITVEKPHRDHLFDRYRKASINWKAIGSVHPGVAEQFAKALRIAVAVAEEPIKEAVEA